MNKTFYKYLTVFICFVLAFVLCLTGCQGEPEETEPKTETIPPFSGYPYVVLQDNAPTFTNADHTTESFEFYSELDALNRCGFAMACIGQDIMPSEERGSIGQVKPSGWQTVKYDIVDGKYLYNRCHLIGYQLTGENANERNLITGTRYLNIEGMLPFENMVADYIKETGNHVLYRVTPVFEGDNLVASGLIMEALSMEDNGDGISFHVYVYNNQPGVIIDYATGDSVATATEEPVETTEETVADTGADTEPTEAPTTEPEETVVETEPETTPETQPSSEYLLNNNSMKFHYPDCKMGQSTSEKNREDYIGSREELIRRGYVPAGCCNP